MSLGIDPAAFILALAAIWFTWREVRRNNTVILKVWECHGSYGMSSENQRKPYCEFRLLIRNLGISLHSPTVALRFRDVGELPSTVSIHLTRRTAITNGSNEFAKGMIAEFGVKSYELDEHALEFLRRFQNARKQDAALVIYSQGYIAKELRIGNWAERLRWTWNRGAGWFNGLFDRRMGTNEFGSPVIKVGDFLPRFVTLESPVLNFAGCVRRSLKPADVPATSTAKT